MVRHAQMKDIPRIAEIIVFGKPIWDMRYEVRVL